MPDLCLHNSSFLWLDIAIPMLSTTVDNTAVNTLQHKPIHNSYFPSKISNDSNNKQNSYFPSEMSYDSKNI